MILWVLEKLYQLFERLYYRRLYGSLEKYMRKGRYYDA